MWTRGEARVHHNSWRDRAYSVFNRLRGGAEQGTTTVYQRVLLVYRTKDNNLHLKLFKNVENDKLELLLPNIDISMSDFDRYVLTGSLAAAALTTGWRMVSSLSSNGLVSPVTGAAAAILATAGLIVLRLWGGISNNRNRYLVREKRGRAAAAGSWSCALAQRPPVQPREPTRATLHLLRHQTGGTQPHALLS